MQILYQLYMPAEWLAWCFSSRQVLCWEGMGIFMQKYFRSFKHSQKADTHWQSCKKPQPTKKYRSWNLQVPDLWMRCAYPTSDLHAQFHLNVIFFLATWSIMQLHPQFVSRWVPRAVTCTGAEPAAVGLCPSLCSLCHLRAQLCHRPLSVPRQDRNQLVMAAAAEGGGWAHPAHKWI